MNAFRSARMPLRGSTHVAGGSTRDNESSRGIGEMESVADVDLGVTNHHRTIQESASIILEDVKTFNTLVIKKMTELISDISDIPFPLSARQEEAQTARCQTDGQGVNAMLNRLAFSLVFSVASMAQSPQTLIVPPAAMTTEGVPTIEVSTKVGRHISLYSKLSKVDLMDWHPTRRAMLVSLHSNKNNASQVFELATPLGRPVQRTHFSNQVNASSWQPSEASTFVVRKDNDGDEVYQLYRVDTRHNKSTLLTDGKSRNGYPVWSPSGDRMAFQSIRDDEKRTIVYVVNPSDPSSLKQLTQIASPNWDEVDDWSPDGKHLLMVNGDPILGPNRIILVDTDSGQQIDITPSEKAAVWVPIGFTADAKGIIAVTNLNSEFRRLAHLDIASKSVTFLTADKWDLDAYLMGDYERPALSRDRKHLAYSMNEDGLSTLHLLDVATLKSRPLPSPMPGAIRNIRWHGNSKEFAFNLVSNGTPGDIYSVNIETCKVDRWTKVGISGLDLTKNAKPELIKWKSFDQREVSGWLYRPSAKFAGKRPVIINIHGGPDFQFRPEFLGVKNYFINELGIAMVFPNVRGSSGYGKTFMTLDDGPRREDAYRDIETLLDWIERDPSLDSSRIMIQGQSYGGHMTFALATRLGKRVACFNAVSGFSNLATISTETTPELGEALRLEFGDVRNPETKAFLERISPINNVKSIQSPMLIVHGKNDPRVRVAESDTMVAAIKRHGTPVWYLRASNEGHGFHHEENVRYSLIATISFVKTYLLNRPSPSTTQPAGAHFVDPNPRLSHWESGLDNELQTPLGHRLWSNG